jgi:hypothetical protein
MIGEESNRRIRRRRVRTINDSHMKIITYLFG